MISGDVAMVKHHAFGLTGSSGSVNQRGQVFWFHRAHQGVEDRIALATQDIGPLQHFAEGNCALG